jgi:hypothetical protein
MLESQVETLWQESLTIASKSIQNGTFELQDPVKVFAKKIGEHLIDQIEDSFTKDQIRKACGFFKRASIVVSVNTGKSFKVQDAVVLTLEHMTEQEWRNYNSAAPMERRVIAKEKGTPLENVIRLENLLR